MSSDPNLQCFCPTPETCLDKGLYDLYKCVKSPVVASLPHFLQCDEKYVQAVEGLHPDEVIKTYEQKTYAVIIMNTEIDIIGKTWDQSGHGIDNSYAPLRSQTNTIQHVRFSN